jgi:hypothetical protein
VTNSKLKSDVNIVKEFRSTTMQCALFFTFSGYFYQLLPPFSRPYKVAASGPHRNRNVNKRTHCIVVDQDSLGFTVAGRA